MKSIHSINKVAAAVAITMTALAWGPRAEAACLLPTGLPTGPNLCGPASQTAARSGHTIVAPSIKDISDLTRFDFGGTPGAKDKNAFADLIIDRPSRALSVVAVASTGSAAFTHFTLPLIANTDSVGGGSTGPFGAATRFGTPGDAARLGIDLADLVPVEHAIVARAVTPFATATGESPYAKIRHQITLTLAEVPLPAAAWLMLSGLFGLFGFGALRRAA